MALTLPGHRVIAGAGLVALLSVILPFQSEGAPANPRARTTSASKQFTIYCEDSALRSRLAGFVEDVKSQVYTGLGLPSRGKIPIVVTLELGPASAPPRLQLIQTPQGPTIQVRAMLGDDPASVHLEKHIVRAVLLDFMYRDRAQPEAGTIYAEPPWWIVSGIIETNRRLERGIESALFRRLVETNKLPALEKLLAGSVEGLGPTAEAFDAACAMALLQLLMEQSDGRIRLGTLLRGWPDNSQNPVQALNRAFPNLGEGAAGLQKWWTVNLARFATSDRYLGFSAEETDRQLDELLEFDIVTDKAGTREHFTIGDFKDFIKKPGARAAMKERHHATVKLGAQAHALLAPAIQGYEQIFFILSRGKSGGVADRIQAAETYRNSVVHRRGEIADFLNWFEATQLGMRSTAFDGYLRMAQAVQRDKVTTTASGEIAKYLDLLQEEFRPIQPR
jgi:hypothetical protein